MRRGLTCTEACNARRVDFTILKRDGSERGCRQHTRTDVRVIYRGIRGSEMVLGRMLSLSTKSIGVGTLDIRTRVRRLRDLAASEESLTEEMVGLVRFLVQAELLFEMSACGDVPYRAAFLVDLARMLDTKKSIIKKLMRENAREARVCVTCPTYLLLTFRAPETMLSIGYVFSSSD
jgi:hypothetical protein